MGSRDDLLRLRQGMRAADPSSVRGSRLLRAPLAPDASVLVSSVRLLTVGPTLNAAPATAPGTSGLEIDTSNGYSRTLDRCNSRVGRGRERGTMTDDGIPVQVEMTARGERIIARQTAETAYDAAIAYAAAQGAQDGLAAASWYFDGNTTDATYTAVLRGLNDGDPAVLDTLPYPDLSGQWADSLTGPQLVQDALSESGTMIDTPDGERHSQEYRHWFTDVCDAYETAFSDAATAEIERVARYQTGGAA